MRQIVRNKVLVSYRLLDVFLLTWLRLTFNVSYDLCCVNPMCALYIWLMHLLWDWGNLHLQAVHPAENPLTPLNLQNPIAARF